MLTRLILASASPRRRELLKELRVPFQVIPPEVTEKNHPHGDPEELVLHNAELKAQAIAEHYTTAPILAADTTVAFNGKIFNKPQNLDEARSMLTELSGKTHQVFTGICLIQKSRNIHITYCERTDVTLKELTPEIIDNYFTKINPLDKAGAYAIQESPEYIIHGYKGHLTNVIGLPTEYLHSLFKKLNLFTYHSP